MNAKPTASAPSAKSSVRLLNGLEECLNLYDHFVLDIWGVLHNGIIPFPHVIDCLARLKENNKQILLLSNTPSTGNTIADDLRHMDITPALYDHIVTAGDSARADLEKRQGQKCWYAGQLHEESLVDGLDLKFLDTPTHANFMINAIYGNNPDTDGKLSTQMQEAADLGLDMICPNPDKVVQVGDTLKLCPGTFAEIYENDMNGTVFYHGKPHTPIYQTAWEYLGAPEKSRVLAIGDSLHTDIQGANGFDIDSVFNLVGIHLEEFQEQYGDTLSEDILNEYLKSSAHRPDMVLNGLQF